MSVRTQPGATTKKYTPWAARAQARDWLMALRPALAAA